jgi:hypothetical protein
MGAMLAEIAEGAMTAATSTGLRATRVEVSLPVEVVWTREALLAELPRFVTRTPFDAPLSRLNVVWEVLP